MVASWMQDRLLGLTPNPSADAVQTIISSIRKLSSAGASHFLTLYLSDLARAYAGLDQFKDAWGYIGEAISLTNIPNKNGARRKSIASPAKLR